VPDQGDAVGLRPVPVRVAERRDRTDVVEERVRVPRRRLEAELVGEVLATVARVVDVDLVEDAVVEAVEVRPAGRSFERDVIGDERCQAGRD
jgi:hypothetical protein